MNWSSNGRKLRLKAEIGSGLLGEVAISGQSPSHKCFLGMK